LRGEGATHGKVQAHSAVSCAKKAEPYRAAIWDLNLGWPKEALLGGGAHWRHLAITTEPSMYGGDVACCQITLTTCY